MTPLRIMGSSQRSSHMIRKMSDIIRITLRLKNLRISSYSNLFIVVSTVAPFVDQSWTSRRLPDLFLTQKSGERLRLGVLIGVYSSPCSASRIPREKFRFFPYHAGTEAQSMALPQTSVVIPPQPQRSLALVHPPYCSCADTRMSWSTFCTSSSCPQNPHPLDTHDRDFGT